jgi:hypothetical protein
MAARFYTLFTRRNPGIARSRLRNGRAVLCSVVDPSAAGFMADCVDAGLPHRGARRLQLVGDDCLWLQLLSRQFQCRFCISAPSDNSIKHRTVMDDCPRKAGG